MKLSRTTTGLAFLVVLATLGAALCFAPPWLLEQYERVARLGPCWVYAYFAVVGTGGAILLGCSAWLVWHLWSGTRRKRRRDGEKPRRGNGFVRNEAHQTGHLM